MNQKLAIIIKGNSELVDNNPKADKFYSELSSFLETLGFQTKFDRGEPYTEPKKAELWIGHSRGSDRLRFAPSETIAIGIGVPLAEEENSFPVVNNPKDQTTLRKFSEGKIIEGQKDDGIDYTNHYILTDEMKKKIKEIIENKEDGSLATTAP